MRIASKEKRQTKTTSQKQMKVAKTEKQLGDLRRIPLEHIFDSDTLTPARELDSDHVNELSESIEKNGLDQPLLVWDGGAKDNEVQVSGGKKFPATFLLAGNHRRAALRKFKKRDKSAFEKMFADGIPVRVISGDLKDAVAAQLRENLDRLNPTPEQILPSIIRLKDEFKMKGKAIAAAIGKSTAYVSEILAIREHLGEEGVEAAKGGNLKDSIKAARKVKKGESTKEAEVEKLKSKKSKKKGKKKAAKRASLKQLFARYRALPSLKTGVRVEILEKLCEYVLGDSDDLPDELQADESEDEAPVKAKKKKVKK